MQVAVARGMRVIALVEASGEPLVHPRHDLVETISYENDSEVVDLVMLLTSGLGVDILLEGPPTASFLSSEAHDSGYLPITTLLQCLAPFGTLVTGRPLQVRRPS